MVKWRATTIFDRFNHGLPDVLVAINEENGNFLVQSKGKGKNGLNKFAELYPDKSVKQRFRAYDIIDAVTIMNSEVFK